MTILFLQGFPSPSSHPGPPHLSGPVSAQATPPASCFCLQATEVGIEAAERVHKTQNTAGPSVTSAPVTGSSAVWLLAPAGSQWLSFPTAAVSNLSIPSSPSLSPITSPPTRLRRWKLASSSSLSVPLLHRNTVVTLSLLSGNATVGGPSPPLLQTPWSSSPCSQAPLTPLHQLLPLGSHTYLSPSPNMKNHTHTHTQALP